MLLENVLNRTKLFTIQFQGGQTILSIVRASSGVAT
jgi:hypothetical protein